MNFDKMYHPITATPFACNETYMELEPCAALKPYIRCFWGSRKPYYEHKTDVPTHGIVTPDTCMDIIFTTDFTRDQVFNKFCGIDDRTFETYHANDAEKEVSVFAIRFYPWSAYLFAEDSLRDTKNAFFDAGYHFANIKKKLEPILFEVTDIRLRAVMTEKVLLEHFHPERQNHLLTEALGEMLGRKGSLEIGALSGELHTSSRTLERLFREYIGISPKTFSSLVRYQCLWQDILYQPQFRILDAVYCYGYTDQSHLMHDFGRFHGMNIAEARRWAFEHSN